MRNEALIIKAKFIMKILQGSIEAQCGNRKRRVPLAAADFFFIRGHKRGKLFYNKEFTLFQEVILMLADCNRGRVDILSRIGNYQSLGIVKAVSLTAGAIGNKAIGVSNMGTKRDSIS